jgi:hypothetical protein
MAVLKSKVELCVETLCHHGCESVSAYIEALRAGQVFVEVADLSAAERQRVLKELVSIMVPYEGEGDS